MRRTLPIILTLIALISIQTIASAQAVPDADDDVQDDAAPVDRAARIRFVSGDVSFLRAGTNEWASAVDNLPLLTGDQLYVGSEGRAEIQLSRGTFVRLLKETTLTITELSSSASQFEVTQGSAKVKVDQLPSAPFRFEIDTPNAALMLTSEGLYSLTVADSQRSEVTVSRGVAEVSTDDGTVKVREGHRLTVDIGSSSQLELAADSGQDGWNEGWDPISDSPIPQVAQSALPDDVTTYESNYISFYGASDLAGYGTWTNNSSYGYCWVPRVDSSWAPYRYGRWLWIPNAGWSWLADEPWGWAPYHYGRWAFIPALGWAWVPGFGGQVRNYGGWDYGWRPSLVYFFNYPTARGSYVGWYPLTPGERWHRPEWYERHRDHGRRENPRPGDGRDRSGVRKRWIDPPRSPRDVTAVPVEAFQNPTRSTPDQREITPRNAADWRDRATQPGLPVITPKVGAVQFPDGKGSRRVVTPSIEVLDRPVVTRHRPSGSEAESSVPRERRLIAPRPVTLVQDESGRSQNKGRDESRKYRVTPPAPLEKAAAGRQPESRQGSDRDDKTNQGKGEREERRRAHEQEREIVTPPPSQNRIVQPAPGVERGDQQQNKHDQQRAERKQEKQERREARQEKRAESGGSRKP